MHKRGVFVLLVTVLFLIAACQSYPVGSRVDGEAALLQKLDLNGNGEIDNDDFFALSNAFGKKRGEEGYDARLDFDGDGEIGNNDFFLLTENFGKKYSKAATALVGDFNGDGCVSQADIDKADADIAALRQRYDARQIADAAFAHALRKYDVDKDSLYWSEKDKDALRNLFGEGCSEEFGGIYSLEDEAAKPALLLDCSQYADVEKDACWDVVANDVNNLDATACGNIQDATLRGYCEEKVCLFAGDCGERGFKAYHVDTSKHSYFVQRDKLDLSELLLEDGSTLEFSSEEYQALEKKDKHVALGNEILIVFTAPADAKAALIERNSQGTSLLDLGRSSPNSQGDLPVYVDDSVTLVRVKESTQSGVWNPFVSYRMYKAKPERAGKGEVVPVIDGKVAILLSSYTDEGILHAGLIDRTGTAPVVVDQFFTKVSFARSEEDLLSARYLGVMDSSGKLE